MISITLAILMEFLVIALFHETKIPMVDMKFQVYFKFSKNKIWKKLNLQAPGGMEDLTIPRIGAKFKKWRCCIHTPKEAQALAHERAFKKKFSKKKLEKKATPCLYKQWLAAFGRLLVAACRSRLPGNQRLSGTQATTDQGVVGSLQPVVTDHSNASYPFTVPLPPSSYLLPQIFYTCDQLFLIGSSTFPPCPNFS
jgi:hypothetical protein